MGLVRRTLRETDLGGYPPERFEGTWDAYESAFAGTEDGLCALPGGGGLDDLAIDRIRRAVTVEPARDVRGEAQKVEPSSAASRSALACLAACAAEGDPAKRAELEQAALDRYAGPRGRGFPATRAPPSRPRLRTDIEPAGWAAGCLATLHRQWRGLHPSPCRVGRPLPRVTGTAEAGCPAR